MLRGHPEALHLNLPLISISWFSRSDSWFLRARNGSLGEFISLDPLVRLCPSTGPDLYSSTYIPITNHPSSYHKLLFICPFDSTWRGWYFLSQRNFTCCHNSGKSEVVHSRELWGNRVYTFVPILCYQSYCEPLAKIPKIIAYIWIAYTPYKDGTSLKWISENTLLGRKKVSGNSFWWGRQSATPFL